MRKYLDQIGIKRKDRPEGWNKPLKRAIKCWFERRIYGFDSRETYSLDFSWRMWLYEHLKMFRKCAGPVIDMTEKKITYNGELYSQLELIDMLIDKLEHWLKDDTDGFSEPYVPEIEQIWAAVCPYMWW